MIDKSKVTSRAILCTCDDSREAPCPTWPTMITTSPSWLAMAWEAQFLSLAVLARKALVVARVALSLPWLMMTLEALAPLWLVIAREALSLS